MNTLSWLLYLAGVSQSLGVLFILLGFGSVVLFVITMILSFCSGNAHDSPSENAIQFGKNFRWFFLSTLFISFLIASALPDKNTVYSIAASEMGEQVLADKRVVNTTNKAFKALDRWLDKQIDDEEEKEEKDE